jgi:hypothetical protein
MPERRSSTPLPEGGPETRSRGAVTLADLPLTHMAGTIGEIVSARGSIPDEELVDAVTQATGVDVPTNMRSLLTKFAWSAKGQGLVELDGGRWVPGDPSPHPIAGFGDWTFSAEVQENLGDVALSTILLIGPGGMEWLATNSSLGRRDALGAQGAEARIATLWIIGQAGPSWESCRLLAAFECEIGRSAGVGEVGADADAGRCVGAADQCERAGAGLTVGGDGQRRLQVAPNSAVP